jgi:cytochrome P450
MKAGTCCRFVCFSHYPPSHRIDFDFSIVMISNAATDLSPEQRISEEEILHNINTFMFVGSDSTSLAVTWTLLLLAKHPSIQDELRAELCGLPRPGNTGDDAVLTHYQELAAAPLLDKVCREVLRLVPTMHSFLRVATQDDVLPDSKGGEGFCIRKGTIVHVPIEGMNLDREIWGEDAWDFV